MFFLRIATEYLLHFSQVLLRHLLAEELIHLHEKCRVVILSKGLLHLVLLVATSLDLSFKLLHFCAHLLLFSHQLLIKFPKLGSQLFSLIPLGLKLFLVSTALMLELRLVLLLLCVCDLSHSTQLLLQLIPLVVGGLHFQLHFVTLLNQSGTLGIKLLHFNFVIFLGLFELLMTLVGLLGFNLAPGQLLGVVLLHLFDLLLHQ